MKTLFFAGILLSAMVLLLNSCKKDSVNGTPAQVLANDINLSTNATFGPYITNKQGLTLYTFANDADSTSSCTGGCETLWRPFISDLSTAKLDAGLTASDFSSITRANGSMQVTYKGWPLYTYSPAGSNGYGTTGNAPEAAGSTMGDGVDGLWFIAKPDYTIMLANKQLTGLDGNLYKRDYTIGTGNTTYFTTATGRTLYTFSVDSFNVNKFTKPDLSNNAVFPIYQQEQVVVPSVLDKTLFGNITVGGKKQMTYKGWPLYTFGQDTNRGSNKAVSVPTPGKWPVAVQNIAEAIK